MDINEVTSIIDDAIWHARDVFGHADNGLEDYDTGEELDGPHPEAVAAAERIMAAR